MKDELISSPLSWNRNKLSYLQTAMHTAKVLRSILSLTLLNPWPVWLRSALQLKRCSREEGRQLNRQAQQDLMVHLYLGKQDKTLNIKEYKHGSSFYAERKQIIIWSFWEENGKWVEERQTVMLMGSFVYLRTSNFKTASYYPSIIVLVEFHYIQEVRKASMNFNAKVMPTF